MARIRKNLPTSSVTAAVEFRMEYLPLAELEAISGRPLDLEAQESLTELIESYYVDAQFEENAPGVEDALRYLAFYKEKAEEFLATISGQGPQGISLNVKNPVQMDVADRLERIGSSVSLQSLTIAVSDLLVALNGVDADIQARKRASDTPYRSGDAWAQFIVRLSGWARRQGIGTHAPRDDAYGKKDAADAPFMKLCLCLYRTFPKRFQKHISDKHKSKNRVGALSRAVRDALNRHGEK